jgi:acetyl esterase/lipase
MRIRALLPYTLAITLATPAAFSQQVVPLWPHASPEPAPNTEPEKDVTTDKDALISGHRSSRLTNVSNPTITIIPPPSGVKNTGSAALVFPGGGYARLAWDGEGLDTCQWLNSVGMTCLLVKYRVPQPGGEAGHYPADYADLEDAQQAMRLARAHASEWHINPKKIGVIGFSAGANLAVLLGTHPDDNHITTTPAAADANTKIDARPDFAVVVYPAYLIVPSADKDHPDPFPKVDPTYMPNQFTPPTFLIQAENDRSYGRNAPAYYEALAAAGIPSELHMYATGGHGFGLHPADRPEAHWTQLASIWLRSMDIIPELAEVRSTPYPTVQGGGYPAPAPAPCPMPAPPPPSSSKVTVPNPAPPPNTTDPACW